MINRLKNSFKVILIVVILFSCSQNNQLALYNGDYKLVVDADYGGRIVEFSLKGVNILTDSLVSDMNFGSTFWPAPQSLWKWPPPKSIHSNLYKIRIHSKEEIYLESSIDEMLGITIHKQFKFIKNNVGLRITYSIVNNSDTVKKVAPWEITCVSKGGELIVPYKNWYYKTKRGTPISFTKKDSCAILSMDSTDIKGGPVILDGSGKIAYTLNSLLFVKKFPDIDTTQFAPNEGEVLFYFSYEDNYIEIENQGAYLEVAPGEKYSYSVNWYLIELEKPYESSLENRKLLFQKIN